MTGWRDALIPKCFDRPWSCVEPSSLFCSGIPLALVPFQIFLIALLIVNFCIDRGCYFLYLFVLVGFQWPNPWFQHCSRHYNNFCLFLPMSLPYLAVQKLKAYCLWIDYCFLWGPLTEGLLFVDRLLLPLGPFDFSNCLTQCLHYSRVAR